MSQISEVPEQPVTPEQPIAGVVQHEAAPMRAVRGVRDSIRARPPRKCPSICRSHPTFLRILPTSSPWMSMLIVFIWQTLTWNWAASFNLPPRASRRTTFDDELVGTHDPTARATAEAPQPTDSNFVRGDINAFDVFGEDAVAEVKHAPTLLQACSLLNQHRRPTMVSWTPPMTMTTMMVLLTTEV